MVWLKYVSGVLVVIAICAVIWFNPSAKVQVNQLEERVSALEEQVGSHYKDTIFSLRVTVDELLEHNFNQPLTDEDEDMMNEFAEEFSDISDTLFFMNRNLSVHSEWQNRMLDVHMYLRNYTYGPSLTKEEVDDLYQALQAIRFITMDFGHIVDYDRQSSYDAMHDKEHEMVERVQYRLSLKY